MAEEKVDLKSPIMDLRQEVCNLLSLFRHESADEPEKNSNNLVWRVWQIYKFVLR